MSLTATGTSWTASSLSTEVSNSTAVESPLDCSIVMAIWKNFNKISSDQKVTDRSNATVCCSMEGVTCQGERVKSLEWANMDLIGEFPNQIFNLLSLENLNLGGNSLNGKVPPGIGDLKKLKTL